MTLFVQHLSIPGYEEVMRVEEKRLGFLAFLAIHSTVLGPAFGGTRLWTYAREEDALQDALRLARGMSYKAAVSGLNCGGGKAVIVNTPGMDRRTLFHLYGQVVQSLRGKFFTGRDVGVTLKDLEEMRKETSFVVDESVEKVGDLNDATALGVFEGMKACLEHTLGTPSFQNLRIALQGVGNVGYALAKRLHSAGARLLVADIQAEKVQAAVKEFHAVPVTPEEILSLPATVFSPCALGGVIHSSTVEKLRAPIVAGCANNVLKADELGDELHHLGILYAPDFVINAGALIQGANFYLKGIRDNTTEIMRIFSRLQRIFQESEREGVSPVRIAYRMAEQALKNGTRN